ncbi:MAG: metallophosphoesterase [Patescibacteria group bacterium]|nr:metallophosphoesterase [Patescibacteria group bacterium]
MKINFIIYFLIFLLVYIAVNFYVIFRFGGLLKIEKNILCWWLILVNFSLPVALYIERTLPNILSKVFYTLSTLWVGILLFMLVLLLIYEIVRIFYPIPYAGVMIATLVILLSIASIINATRISVKEVKIPIKNLEKPISIVQLSDIHLGTIRNSVFLKKIVKKTGQLNPDMVMITGDMIDGSARLHKGMFDEFNKLNAPVYFVTGNHEVMEGVNKVYALLDDVNVRVLKNEVVDSGGIQIIGLEYSEDKNNIGNEFAKLEIDKMRPSVFMYHSPEVFDFIKKAGVDLQLAGHTHNGQIFPFNFLVSMVYQHTKGLYDLGEMFLYVSSGTGTWGPYMRLGSINEITFLKLFPG